MMKKTVCLLFAVVVATAGQALEVNVKPGHPRLLCDAAGFAALRSDRGELDRAVKARVFAEADEMLALKPVERRLSGRRLLDISRRVVHRLLTLSMAYRLSDDARYLARAKAELAAVCSFSDWNPAHFLDVGEAMFAVGVAYDWLYADLTDAERATIRKALVEKGLKANGSSRWMNWENNWNLVCHAGYVTAALAIAEYEPGLAREYVTNAVELMPHAIASYRGGNFPEGPGYWYYASQYLSIALAALESACGTAFGLDRLDGLSRQTRFLNAVTGPTGLLFAYSDCGTNPDSSPRGFDFASFFFAKRFNDPGSLVEFEIPALRRYCALSVRDAVENDHSRHFPLALLYLPDEAAVAAARSVVRPVCESIRGENHVASFRERWGDTNAAYVAVKGGGSLYSHAHKDGGNFVFERDGVRWFTDLGCEPYGRLEEAGVDIWNGAMDSDRWKLFRYSTGGHSVVQIDGAEQCGGPGNGVIVGEYPDDATTVTLDLSSLYTNVAAEVTRTVSLAGRDFSVEDRIRTRPGARVVWHGIVRAEVTLEGTRATLRSGDKTLVLVGSSPWSVEDVSKPAGPYESENPGVRRLALVRTAPEDGRVGFLVKSGE